MAAKPKVLVGGMIPKAGLDLVQEACEADVWTSRDPLPRDVLLDKVRGVSGFLCMFTNAVDGELMDVAGPELKVVSCFAVGYDNVDVEAATTRGIPVGNTPGVLTGTTADLAFALIMAAARRIVEGAEYVKAGEWGARNKVMPLGTDVHGATLGIIGMGRIGRTVARRGSGFDMRVIYHDPYCDPESPPLVGAGRPCDLDELLAEADFVSVHVPLSEETRHLIDARALAQMKPTGILINTSRGPVVDTEALYDALAAKQIAGAALDVTDPEPLPADHKLLSLSNCVVVPHVGSASVATRDRMAVLAAENLIAGLRGEPLPHCVNPEVYGTGGG
jgi:lactate dehydrogenase-like 2-hydroxyacid dehydrogenase